MFLLVFLASCGSDTISQTTTKTTETQVAVEQTQKAIEEATAQLPESTEVDVEEILEEIVDLPQEADTTVEIQSEDEPQPVAVVEKETKGSKLIELSTTYDNPKIEVVLDLDIEVDENNVIQSIDITSPNYKHKRMTEFNTKIQNVIGLTLDEASDYNVSGSSLLTSAFQAVLKKS